LSRLQEVASVSGGSITAGVLARAWAEFHFDDHGCAANFTELVAVPLMRFASVGVDVKPSLLACDAWNANAPWVRTAVDLVAAAGVSVVAIARLWQLRNFCGIATSDPTAGR
jgi:hypothetical protein